MSKVPPIWRIALVNKLAILAAIGVGLWTIEFSTRSFTADRLAPWDCALYLTLSTEGYQPGLCSCAFYPLWPGMIGAFAHITAGNGLLAALLLSNVLSLLAFWLFHDLVKRSSGETIATSALVLMLLFPGALFFSFPYTESLFLVMVLVLFRGLEQQKYLLPCVMAFLMPLTKAVGVFVALPLMWHLYEKRKPLRYWTITALPLLGYAAYFGIMYGFTGNALEGFEAQKDYPNAPSITNMFDVAGIMRAFSQIGSITGMCDGALDRIFFLLFLATLPLVYRLNKTWFFYSLPVGLIPALTNWFISYRRYCMMCFPIFIVLAQLQQKRNHRFIYWYLGILLASLQSWLIAQFLRFNWAG